jgi:hypothetical protein
MGKAGKSKTITVQPGAYGPVAVFALAVTVVLYGLWGTSGLGKGLSLGLVGLLLLVTALYGALGGDSAAGDPRRGWCLPRCRRCGLGATAAWDG